MRRNQDLIGQTITGVIAGEPDENGRRTVWMLQFADGTHVEFVTPDGRRRLERSAARGRGRARPRNSAQLSLNVA